MVMIIMQDQIKGLIGWDKYTVLRFDVEILIAKVAEYYLLSILAKCTCNNHTLSIGIGMHSFKVASDPWTKFNRISIHFRKVQAM